MQASYRGPHVLDRIERSIPSAYYYDPAHYQRELEVFWYRRWVYACRSDAVPGPRDYVVANIGTQGIIITRDLKGGLHAFHNTCRHRGSILCTDNRGSFKGGTIMCPYHAWTYSLEGDLISTPHQLENTDFRMEQHSLYPVALGEWGGYVFVNLAGGGAEPLEATLGDIPNRYRNYPMADLKVGYRAVIDVEANWKLLFENFSECFHCPTVHPELCAVVPIYGEGLLGEHQRRNGEGDWTPTGGQSQYRRLSLAPGMVTFTMDGTTKRPFFPNLTEEERNTAYSTGVLRPNFFMNVHPDYVHTHKMLPTGPTSVQMTFEWLFEPSTMARPDFDLKQAVELWDITNRQDARNCEWQQRGLFSRQHKHSVFVPQETGPHRFNQWVLEQLGESN